MKIAKYDGWFLARHGKEHDIYKHPTKKGRLVIERHGSAEIKKGLSVALMKQVKGE